MEKNRPAPIRDILKKTIEDIESGKEGVVYKEDIIRAWENVVGKTASRHSAPAGIKKGVLIINVDSPVWIYQLNMKKREIEQRLNREIGQGRRLKILLRAGEQGD